ncbi:RNA polymerase sigma factor [Delftia sp. WSY_4]|uniref:RNA polymerase sigma factor n=1 Tax=unclassified Delftia TaxID=2613839 RepID=UPI00370B08D1
MTRHPTSAAWLGLDLHWAYGSLLPAIWRSTRCIHRAQDVLHDAFVRYALSGRHEGIAQPHAYLRVVARTVLADQMAHERRFVPLPELAGEAGAAQHPVARADEIALQEAFTAPSAEMLADLQQRLGAVQRVIQGLPARCREVFWLCKVEGHSQPQIAAMLGISLNMVERHLMRALLDLRAARELLAP